RICVGARATSPAPLAMVTKWIRRSATSGRAPVSAPSPPTPCATRPSRNGSRGRSMRGGDEMDVVIFPDIEDLLVEYLSAELPKRGCGGVSVHTQKIGRATWRDR